MNEKEKAPEGTNIFTEGNGKGNYNLFKYKILSALSSGQYSALKLNQLFFTGDARKYISILRSDGYPISDYWVKTKFARLEVYFLKGGDHA